MSNNFSIDNIIKHIASFDSNGASRNEIDTQKEYDYLGEFLNGSLNILNTNATCEDDEIIRYTDLLKDSKIKLFNIMNNLKTKFGEWIFQFDLKQAVNDENSTLYVNRLMNYKLKLDKLKNNEEEYTQYYNDNKDEINEIENKLKKYCTEKGFKIEQYDAATLKKLADTIEEINQNNNLMQEMREFENILKQNEDNFKITNEFAKEYMYLLEDIIYWENDYIDTGIFSDTEKNVLKQALVDYLSIYSDEITKDNIGEYNLSFCLESAIKLHKKNDQMKDCNEKVQKSLTKSHKDKLKSVAEQFIDDNNIPKLKNVPKGVDIGNGKFDKVSTQKTENCWIHAQINSLLATEKGTQLLENNYYRDKRTGIITIHLQEAEDMGLHGGIYTITPQEIIDSQDTLASGEGEISAYIIAIQKYFEEVNENPELKNNNNNKIFLNIDEGNTGFRFWEIITGGNHTEWRSADGDKNKINNGIGISKRFEMETLYQKIQQGKCAVTISLKSIAHNISIVGVKDNKFLIQESNNSETIFDNHLGVDDEIIFTKEEPINGRPTYGLTIENANEYDLGAINYIIWE